MQKTQQYIQTNLNRFLNELLAFLRIPSISTKAEHKEDLQKAASFLIERFKEAGADAVKLVSTYGHPIVYAEKIIDPRLPTILVYGHYDVQPVEPLHLWHSPPFEPVIRDGKIFARGASDDKGQTYMHLKAFEAMVKTGELPCNAKFIIEGEEEVGSESLPAFLKSNAEGLAADVVLISDTSMIANHTPSLTVGLRGIVYLQVELTGPQRDLHSGVYGGGVINPINTLCQMIACLKDEKGRITIPGFYDKVTELSPQERAALAQVPFDEENFKKELAVEGVAGEEGYTTLERMTIRPTLDVNGIWGGYTGEGAKTVIPSKAYAKISMRLVPDQDFHEIGQLFTDYFTSLAPRGIKVNIQLYHGGQPVVVPMDSIAYRAAELAMEKTFGKKPIPQREGGSIPIVPLFHQILKVNTIMMGFGLNSDNIHSPNEHFGLFNYLKGIETIPYFYHYFTELSKQQQAR
ncbi:MAG: dipeptidase [Bernardetiaceae bacterium]|nr:dipeptidase [Bernardetiaceae bacterium]